jgi:tetratricopeptide (TPR) repeat protein
MSSRQFPCPSCHAVLRTAASTPANALIRCPKCDERFRTPDPAEDGEQGITSAEAKTAPRAAHSPATAPEDDAAVLRKIRRPAPRPPTVLWLIFGSVAAGFLLFVALGIAASVWLVRSSTPPPAPPSGQFVPPPPGAPPPAPAPAAQASTAPEWLAQGNRCMKQGDLDGAINAFTRAIELDPRLAAAYTNRGLARSYKGDYDAGIADCTKSIELDPTVG